jgi:Tfp pilus assembly protein PilO
MKELSKREKMIAAVVAMVLVVFLVNRFLFEPQVRKVRELRAELTELTGQTASIAPKLVEFNKLNSDLVIKKRQLEEIKQVLSRKAELAEIISAVSRQAKSHGLQIQQLRPQRATAMRSRAGKPSEYRQLSVDLGMSGRYEELGDFLDALEQQPFYIRVAELRAHRGRRRPPLLDIQLKLAIVMRS